MYVSAVLLPDGKVLETGGALHNRADPVYETSLFDPESTRPSTRWPSTPRRAATTPRRSCSPTAA